MATLGATSRLSIKALAAYALPAAPLQAMMVPLLLTLPPLYAQDVGLSLGVISVILMITRVSEAISDPLIGALTDRSPPGRWQRAGWMIAGAPLAMASAFALLHPPKGVGALYLLICLLLFYMGWTMVQIPYQSWGTDLSDDFSERSRVSGYRETGAFSGYLLSALLPIIALIFILKETAPTFGEQAKVTGWFFLFALPLSVLLCVWLVPKKPASKQSAHVPWSELLGLLKRNKPFQRLLASYLLDRLALGVHFALLPFYIQYVMNMLSAYLVISLVISIAPILSIPLWLIVARRLSKHRAYAVANIITALGYLMLYVIPPGGLGLMILSNVIRGCGNAGTATMPASMTADTVDYDDWRSGVRQAGAHNAFLIFVQKLGLAGGALGLTFAAFYGFKSAGGAHTAQALEGVRIGVAVLPALLLVPSIALMWNFTLDERRQGILRRKLAKRDASRLREANPVRATDYLQVE